MLVYWKILIKKRYNFFSDFIIDTHVCNDGQRGLYCLDDKAALERLVGSFLIYFINFLFINTMYFIICVNST